MARSSAFALSLLTAAAFGTILPAPRCRAETPKITYANQGPLWTEDKRTLFYNVDQGSQLIPLAWLEALQQPDGKPFLDGSLARYGFLPTADPPKSRNLPIGFTRMPTDQGPMVGVTCAACHVRDLTVGKTTYRIDGGPSFNDFAPFAADLDAAVTHVHDDPAAFQAFAAAVLGAKAKDETAVAILRADLDLWWVRYHTFIGNSLPKDRLWGPSRMDAISLIYNRLAGLDMGPPPTYLIPSNIEVGHAPVRYPFLWNASRQEITQWTGFAANGNDFYRLTRNLGEEYGVFGTFHPQKTTATFTILDRNYMTVNSANFAGLKAAENATKDMAPPLWPWPVDRTLADKGKAVFERPGPKGSCADCHGIREIDAPKGGDQKIFATPVLDAGTDRGAWLVVLRKVDTGSMRGASIQGLVPPLKQRDLALSLLRAAVVGAIADFEEADPQAAEERADNPKRRIHDMAFKRFGLGLIRKKTAVKGWLGFGPPPPPKLVVNGYESRVLQGIWAAAPYLHNGSVPSLEELLKPDAQRVKRFKLGPEYDPQTVGLATNQPRSGFVLETTGCEDLYSGDSNCGHDYGTELPAADKKALLEYLKTL